MKKIIKITLAVLSFAASSAIASDREQSRDLDVLGFSPIVAPTNVPGYSLHDGSSFQGTSPCTLVAPEEGAARFILGGRLVYASPKSRARVRKIYKERFGYFPQDDPEARTIFSGAAQDVVEFSPGELTVEDPFAMPTIEDILAQPALRAMPFQVREDTPGRDGEVTVEDTTSIVQEWNPQCVVYPRRRQNRRFRNFGPEARRLNFHVEDEVVEESDSASPEMRRRLYQEHRIHPRSRHSRRARTRLTEVGSGETARRQLNYEVEDTSVAAAATTAVQNVQLQPTLLDSLAARLPGAPRGWGGMQRPQQRRRRVRRSSRWARITNARHVLQREPGSQLQIDDEAHRRGTKVLRRIR